MRLTVKYRCQWRTRAIDPERLGEGILKPLLERSRKGSKLIRTFVKMLIKPFPNLFRSVTRFSPVKDLLCQGCEGEAVNVWELRHLILDIQELIGWLKVQLYKLGHLLDRLAGFRQQFTK